MSPSAWTVLALLLTPGPGCGIAADAASLRLRHFEMNLLRLEAGLAPLTSHPVFCQLAEERAITVAATGSTDVDIPFVSATTREIYRRGYQPHDWKQTALLLGPADSLLEHWLDVKPDSFASTATVDHVTGRVERTTERVRAPAGRNLLMGDYQHLGLAVAHRGAATVYVVFTALPKRVAEWRQAEPLRDLEWVRREILDEVNRLRSERKLRPLIPDERLDRAAQAHAEDLLANAYYSHRGLDGSTGRQRAAAAGRRSARVISENIAKGPFNPREVVQRWMNSRGHRRNILAPGSSEMGVGVAFGENPRGFEILWVQMFAG